MDTQYYYSHLPEFTVEVPEDAEAETTEVQKILLLEVRGVLQKQIDNYLTVFTNKTGNILPQM